MEDDLLFIKRLRNAVGKGLTISEKDFQRATDLVSSALIYSFVEDSNVAFTRIIITGFQFFANISSAAKQTTQCWKLIFPELILTASNINFPDILDPLCYALFNFAKQNLFNLNREGATIFKNIVRNVASYQNNTSMTSFSLLLGQVLKPSTTVSFEDPNLLRSLSKTDIALFDQEVIHRVLQELFELSKKDAPSALMATTNFCTAQIDDAFFMEMASWAAERLHDISKNERKLRRGYKTDVIALLSNLVWKRPLIQDQMMDQNVLELVINCIRFDDSNPYIREWSLLFVRNMCIEHPRAQTFVRQLNLIDVTIDPALNPYIEYDKLSRRFVVKSKETGP